MFRKSSLVFLLGLEIHMYYVQVFKIHLIKIKLSVVMFGMKQFPQTCMST